MSSKEPTLSHRRSRWIFAAGGLLALTVWSVVTRHYLPTGGDRVGEDYSYFIPYLLNGYYWYLDNGLLPPWFTPAFCAGIPHYANPQSMFYSVPQLATLFFDPLYSVQLTFHLFAAVGFCGAWLLTGTKSRDPLIKLFVATAFMLNGFYMVRMFTGHLTVHGFMLLPLLVWLLVVGRQGLSQWLSVTLAGVIFAYLVHSGAGVWMVPMLVAMAALVLLLSPAPATWLRVGVAGVIGVALSLSKLVAVYYFMGQFVRDLYKLPGADGLLSSIYLTLRGLVWPMSWQDANELIVNRSFRVGSHELDYTIGIVPVAILVLGALGQLRHLRPWRPTARVVLLIVIFALPVLLNTYWRPLNAFLVDLPYFQTASSLFRWNIIYMLPLLLLAAGYLSRLEGRLRRPAVMLAIVGVAGGAFFKDLSEYSTQEYDPWWIVGGYYAARQAGEPPQITRIETSIVNGVWLPTMGVDDVLIQGASQLVCYEPMFGYRLETFRFYNIHEDDVFARVDGHFNFYRPECFIYPEANGCEPGDRFTVPDRSALESLTRYQPHAFEMPGLQKVANGVNVAALALVGLFLLAGTGWRLRDIMKESSHSK